MDLDLFLKLLKCHLAAMQTSTWPTGAASPGPALYLDEADTQALIKELTRLKDELAFADAAMSVQKRRYDPGATARYRYLHQGMPERIM